MAPQEQLCGRQPHRQMEETRLRKGIVRVPGWPPNVPDSNHVY